MSAVARLVFTYFTSTRLACVFSAGGLASCLVAAWVIARRGPAEHMLAFAMVGQLALFLGSSNMPLLAGRLSQGQAARLLPVGRVKLLSSIVLTVAVVSLPTGLLGAFGINGVIGQVSRLATDAALRSFLIHISLVFYTAFCILAGWLYLAMWFLTSQRNSAGFSKALVVIVIMVLIPPREMTELDASLRDNLVKLLVAWLVFSAIFLARSKLQVRGPGSWIPGLEPRAKELRSAGKEIDLMLGTHNPWVYVGALLVPVFLAARIEKMSPAVWLYILTIFSTVTGAVAGQAAERSRVLWLRGGWSRAELFRRVEAAFARHNNFVLGALLVLMLGIGAYERLPVEFLAAGLPLLILGTASSTYLGLMTTRGLRWQEALLGIVLMLTLMTLPLMLERGGPDITAVVTLEALLAVVVLVLRFVARNRWAAIDWAECRRARAPSQRVA
ncbi:MAG TPA: hypothetical protein VFL16_15830 [Steroidobacteraceae bacterium]|nr:hypothetical protein [Steroidobacteraceae bacterium]